MTSDHLGVVEDSESRALLQLDIDAHQSMRSAFVERREDRTETKWLASVRIADGPDFSCQIKDISRSGAKLFVPRNRELPQTFMFKIVGRNFVCLVSQAWRRGSYVGVRIERVGKLPGKTAAIGSPCSAGSDRMRHDHMR